MGIQKIKKPSRQAGWQPKPILLEKTQTDCHKVDIGSFNNSNIYFQILYLNNISCELEPFS